MVRLSKQGTNTPNSARTTPEKLKTLVLIPQSSVVVTPSPLYPDRMNMEQAMVYLGVKRRKIDYLKANGELHYIKIGRRVVFDKRDLDTFLRAHRI